MEEIAISKFKATCLSILERVRKTGKPIRVTRFGQLTSPRSIRQEALSPRCGSGAELGPCRF